jgi:hypothetical protein
MREADPAVFYSVNLSSAAALTPTLSRAAGEGAYGIA